MNNILDYSHMIKTYIKITEFDVNYEKEDIGCKCDKNFECFQIKEFNNCKNKDVLLDNLPLFKILINPNTKIKFYLPNTFNNSNINLIDFIKMMVFIIKFKDESVDYLLNKKYIKCITILSVYILIINNFNNIKNIMFMFEQFVFNIKEGLKLNYLGNDENMNKLKTLFKKYFKHSPDECIKIMNSWDTLLEQLLNE